MNLRQYWVAAPLTFGRGLIILAGIVAVFAAFAAHGSFTGASFQVLIAVSICLLCAGIAIG